MANSDKKVEFVEVAEFKRPDGSKATLAVGKDGRIAIRDLDGSISVGTPLEWITAMAEFRNKQEQPKLIVHKLNTKNGDINGA